MEIKLKIDGKEKIQDLIWHKLYHINFDNFVSLSLPIQSHINIYIDGSCLDRQKLILSLMLTEVA